MSYGIVLFPEAYLNYITAFISDYKKNYENNWKLIASDFKDGLDQIWRFLIFLLLLF